MSMELSLFRVSPSHQQLLADSKVLLSKFYTVGKQLEGFVLSEAGISRAIDELRSLGIQTVSHAEVNTIGECYRLTHQYLIADAVKQEQLLKLLQARSWFKVGLGCLLQDGFQTWNDVLQAKHAMEKSGLAWVLEAAPQDFSQWVKDQNGHGSLNFLAISREQGKDSGQSAKIKEVVEASLRQFDLDADFFKCLTAFILHSVEPVVASLHQQVQTWTNRYVQAEADKAALAEQLEVSKLLIHEQQQQVKANQEQLNACQRTIRKRDKQLVILEEQLNRFRRQQKQKNSDENVIQIAQGRISQLEQQLAEAQSLTHRLQVRCDQVEEKWFQAELELEEKDGQMELQLAEKEDRIAELEEILYQVREMFTKLNGALPGINEKKDLIKDPSTFDSVELPMYSDYYNRKVTYLEPFMEYWKNELRQGRHRWQLVEKLRLILERGLQNVPFRFKSLESKTRRGTPTTCIYTRILYKYRLAFEILPDEIVVYELLTRDELSRVTAS